jgi:predicted ester cyclase
VKSPVVQPSRSPYGPRSVPIMQIVEAAAVDRCELLWLVDQRSETSPTCSRCCAVRHGHRHQRLEQQGGGSHPGAVQAGRSRQLLRRRISAFPDWHREIRHLVVDGDYIAVHFTVTGTHRGAFQGIEATGRRLTISEFTLHRVEDGKFAEVWDLADMDAVMRQIGHGEAQVPLTAAADEAVTADS